MIELIWTSLSLGYFKNFLILLNFLFKTQFLSCFQQTLESYSDTELNIFLEFLYTNWTECIVFTRHLLVQSIITIHQTFVIDAVMESEHVWNFVSHCMTSKSYIISICQLLVSRPAWVISLKRKNSSTFTEICPAEHIIPFDTRVKIHCSHT